MNILPHINKSIQTTDSRYERTDCTLYLLYVRYLEKTKAFSSLCTSPGFRQRDLDLPNQDVISLNEVKYLEQLVGIFIFIEMVEYMSKMTKQIKRCYALLKMDHIDNHRHTHISKSLEELKYKVDVVSVCELLLCIQVDSYSPL